MLYQKFKPTASLHPFVECYFVWQGEAAQGLEVQSPPNCFSAVVFNYADPYLASQNNQESMPVPRAFVSGQFTSNYQLSLRGNIGMVGVVLKPCAVHNFFGVTMSHLVNSRAPLSYLKGVAEDELWEAVRHEYTVEGRIKILEDFMLAYLNRGKGNVSIIDESVEYIDECRGCVTVDGVAAHLGISRRYLEKKFLEKVGLSPKYYARLKRFAQLSNKIAHSDKIDWHEIVHEYGFYDQSHLAKEFLEFNRMNPSQYHLLHRELTRFVKTT
ncbi:DUF6597 domain-containing transcriptional factor [Chryseolinea lacunae]|uniref:AraC family transcriptional regulator n=1 Tax=Chryseolinea lacunae TaxID=2801331 RepID=A0ABS1KZ97_9BACT|nr:DUF6597 domain-containing transcriptional factor [Chryseolinea lacunae]MBL0744796.1 AraC family transcriptional regulator [Chryseolinea lacunae]